MNKNELFVCPECVNRPYIYPITVKPWRVVRTPTKVLN